MFLTRVANYIVLLSILLKDSTMLFRDNLWYKMIKLGIHGKILNIIKSMYSVVKSRIKYDNKLGTELFCCLGVRQGECLSPMFFFLF